MKRLVIFIVQILLLAGVTAESKEKTKLPDKSTLWKMVLKNETYRNMSQKHKGKISMKNAEFGKNATIQGRPDECYVLYSDNELVYYLGCYRNKKGEMIGLPIVAYPKTLEKNKILNLPEKGNPVYYSTGKPYFSVSEERKNNLNKEDDDYITALLEVLNENFHAAYSLPFCASFLDDKYIDKTDFVGKYFLIPGLISYPENTENISDAKKEMYELFGYFSYDFPHEIKKIEPPVPSAEWGDFSGSIHVMTYTVDGRQVAYINRVDKSLYRPYIKHDREKKESVYSSIKTQVSDMERKAKRNIIERQLQGLNKILEENELDSWDDMEKAGLSAKQKAILELDQSARKILNMLLNTGYLMQREKKWFFIGRSKTLETPNLYSFEDKEKN